MKILLVDCREKRGAKLKQVLEGDNRHKVAHTEQIDGGDSPLEGWGEEKEACAAYLQQENPEIVLLHVGDEQRYCQECLKDIYGDHVVVCFTGRGIPEKVKADCASNPRHCWYPGVFAAGYPTEAGWRQSAEVSAILKFIDGVEEHLKQPKDSEEAKGILKKAKETLQQFDLNLENALNELTDDLRDLLLGSEQLAEQSLKDLAAKRDELFKDSRP